MPLLGTGRRLGAVKMLRKNVFCGVWTTVPYARKAGPKPFDASPALRGFPPCFTWLFESHGSQFSVCETWKRCAIQRRTLCYLEPGLANCTGRGRVLWRRLALPKILAASVAAS